MPEKSTYFALICGLKIYLQFKFEKNEKKKKKDKKIKNK